MNIIFLLHRKKKKLADYLEKKNLENFITIIEDTKNLLADPYFKEYSIFILGYDSNDKLESNKGATFFGYNLKMDRLKGKRFKEDKENGFDMKNEIDKSIFENYKKNINTIREFFTKNEDNLKKIKSIVGKNIKELNKNEKELIHNTVDNIKVLNNEEMAQRKFSNLSSEETNEYSHHISESIIIDDIKEKNDPKKYEFESEIQIKNELNQIKIENKELKDKLAKEKTRNNELENEIEVSYKKQNQNLKAKIKEQDQKMEKLRKDYSIEAKKVDVLKKELSNKNAKIKEIEKNSNNLNAELNQKKQELEEYKKKS